MNTETINIAGLPVEVVRKRIGNLHVGVYPPDGRVRVAAPVSLSDDAVRMAVLNRFHWIKKQQMAFLSQERETPRSHVSGETHYVFGCPYRLIVTESDDTRCVLSLTPDKRIKMMAPQGSTGVQRARWMQEWYRKALKQKALPRVEKWADNLHLPLPRFGIKKMKTKWGSCNPNKELIWLNIDLAKKPLICLDYVILHEMAHFVSPRHDDEFVAVIDRYMPKWRQVRSDLNALPLSAYADHGAVVET